MRVMLSGKVAVVTGGGTGIGRATAEALARVGASVVVAGRRPEPLDEAVRAITALGGNAVSQPADLSDASAAAAVVRRAVDEFGGLDLAVNAAGAAGVGTAVGTDEALFDRLVRANLKTTWLALKHQIPAIAGRGGGAIVNVSSRAGLTGTAGGAVYSATKHAVIGLTKSAALEAGAAGVRINAVCPGQTRTPQFDRIIADAMPGTSPDDAALALGAKLPLGRIADPKEVAETIAWLLGPAASFITGAVISIDGGGGAG